MDAELKDNLETGIIIVFLLGLGYFIGIVAPITDLPTISVMDLQHEYGRGYDAGYAEAFSENRSATLKQLRDIEIEQMKWIPAIVVGNGTYSCYIPGDPSLECKQTGIHTFYVRHPGEEWVLYYDRSGCACCRAGDELP